MKKIVLFAAMMLMGVQNMNAESSQIDESKDNISKVNAKNVGKCYMIGNIKALTFEQMRFIASNRLSVEDIDKLGDLCGFKNVGKIKNNNTKKEKIYSHQFVSGEYSLKKNGYVELEDGKDGFTFYVECSDKKYVIRVHCTQQKYFEMLLKDIEKASLDPDVSEYIHKNPTCGFFTTKYQGFKYLECDYNYAIVEKNAFITFRF